MFIDDQSQASKNYYERMLKLLASLSGLFSDNTTPYLHYRVAENLFCRAFSAENRSRADTSVDATKNSMGIGIKTFIEKSGSSFEKIAEFNAEHTHFKELSDPAKVRLIAQYRNDRIETTKRAYGISDTIYHCVVRAPRSLKVYDTSMSLIDLDTIRIRRTSGNQIYFTDGANEYKFDVSKSTLYTKFTTPRNSFVIPTEILEHPFDKLESVFEVNNAGLSDLEPAVYPFVILPLYSTRGGLKTVPERSGLNQWNARGRDRDANEIYLQIPIWIHRAFPDFFPPREEPFTLDLPDGRSLIAKVCQENGKALMSNPNAALGEWLLRDVLHQSEGTLLTYERLRGLDIDSVKVTKQGDKFAIDFMKAGTFDDFENEFAPEDANA